MKLDNEENTYCYTVRNPLTDFEEDIYIEADSFEIAKDKIEHRLRNTAKIIVSGFQVNEE